MRLHMFQIDSPCYHRDLNLLSLTLRARIFSCFLLDFPQGITEKLTAGGPASVSFKKLSGKASAEVSGQAILLSFLKDVFFKGITEKLTAGGPASVSFNRLSRKASPEVSVQAIPVSLYYTFQLF